LGKAHPSQHQKVSAACKGHGPLCFYQGWAEIEQMADQGRLAKALAGYEERPTADCKTCGGEGYIICSWCQGSKRSLRHGFAHNVKDASLKCTVCNENALQRCPDC
jgi:hypothetical protein